MIDESEDGSLPPNAYSEDGVDLTLIRWMLSLTPLERLEALQGAVDSLWELTNGRLSTAEFQANSRNTDRESR